MYRSDSYKWTLQLSRYLCSRDRAVWFPFDTLTVTRKSFKKYQPKIINYRSNNSRLGYNIDARDVFLDISKAFDKVWHEVLIYKLESMGISDSLLKLLQSFLTNRFQRVLLSGQTFRIVFCKSRCATRAYSWSTPISNRHIWFVREHWINCKTLNWWYFSILSGT